MQTYVVGLGLILALFVFVNSLIHLKDEGSAREDREARPTARAGE
jgi:hypothetical protein